MIIIECVFVNFNIKAQIAFGFFKKSVCAYKIQILNLIIFKFTFKKNEGRNGMCYSIKDVLLLIYNSPQWA